MATRGERNPPAKPIVVLICGIAGSGKTTCARELENAGYVRLSIDEEVWERFGRYGVDYSLAQYDEHSAIVERVLRARLVRLFDANAAFPITDDILAAYLDAFEEPSGEGEELVTGPSRPL